MCVLRLGYNVRGDASVVSRRGAGFRYVRDVDEIRSIPPRTFVLLVDTGRYFINTWIVRFFTKLQTPFQPFVRIRHHMKSDTFLAERESPMYSIEGRKKEEANRFCSSHSQTSRTSILLRVASWLPRSTLISMLSMLTSLPLQSVHMNMREGKDCNRCENGLLHSNYSFFLMRNVFLTG